MNVNRIYSGIARRMPGRLAALADQLHPHLPDTYGPMNGQMNRMEIVRNIFSKVRFQQVLETGTFRGETTQFLASLTSAPVHSAEVVDRFYRYSSRNCRVYPNVRLHLQDSREMLESLSREVQSDEATFLYLDAHWEADVPRRTEIEIVRRTWGSSVIMIDDFLVPGDEGYGVARYGGRVLDATYLPSLEGWQLFYPERNSSEETGARRGCAVIASPPLADAMTEVAGLRLAATLS